MSFGSLLKEKADLTNEVREAGITQSDEDIINQFADTMTDNSNSTLADLYQPKEEEITKSLNFAKDADSVIFKQHHPKQFAEQ